jgi:hypothetical protein
MNEHQQLPLAEIRELARRFTPEQIEACIQAELEDKDNPCYQDPDIMNVVNVLAKAEFVRKQMEAGKSLPEAIRELGRRIRAAQGKG